MKLGKWMLLVVGLLVAVALCTACGKPVVEVPDTGLTETDPESGIASDSDLPAAKPENGDETAYAAVLEKLAAACKYENTSDQADLEYTMTNRYNYITLGNKEYLLALYSPDGSGMTFAAYSAESTEPVVSAPLQKIEGDPTYAVGSGIYNDKTYLCLSEGNSKAPDYYVTYYLYEQSGDKLSLAHTCYYYMAVNSAGSKDSARCVFTIDGKDVAEPVFGDFLAGLEMKTLVEYENAGIGSPILKENSVL